MSRPITYEVRVTVDVHDIDELREYAMKRAHDAGMSLKQFNGGVPADEHGAVEYYLGWAFDAGTPEGAGFQIEESSVKPQ